MKFEWDVKKYDKNIKKHDIDFIEASSIFGDKNILSIFMPRILKLKSDGFLWETQVQVN